MKAPRFHQITATNYIDQAGLTAVVLFGLDAFGRVWSKAAAAPWEIVDNEAVEPPEKSTARSLQDIVKGD